MINPFVNNGNLFYISASLPATYDGTGYGALSYTQVRGMRAIDDIGVKYETVDFNLIGEVRHNKRVGTQANSINIEVFKIDDAGQTLLKALALPATINSYSFKVVLVDGTIYYFTATCSYRGGNAGESGNVQITKLTLDLDSALLEV
jgi:hypothetical protein